MREHEHRCSLCGYDVRCLGPDDEDWIPAGWWMIPGAELWSERDEYLCVDCLDRIREKMRKEERCQHCTN